MTEGFKLPANTSSYANQKVEGFATPKADTSHQCAVFLPKRVLPIIFLPGIMGSNLRITNPERIRRLGQTDNKAWRPDDLGATSAHAASTVSPRERQLRLDPATTAVDIYNPNGPSDESGDGRHGNVKLASDFTSALLADDPPTKDKEIRRTAVQKARIRGWGEVYFKSYGELLQHLESRLNGTFSNGKMQPAWQDVVGVNPSAWRPDATLPQQPLTEEELKKVATGCWFPVYAFGYNWLQSNGVSAKAIGARITAVMKSLNDSGFECPKVIVVTHSMGGMVGRALIHPDYGGLKDSVLGIVHGAQPAIGAAAAYKRIRAGFEDPGIMHGIEASVGSKVAGNMGDEVTAVLANAPGGLELLPTQAYGNEWLQVTHDGHRLDAWPKKGDPYEEIYKVRGKWYSLIREEWINPADLPPALSSWNETVKKIQRAKGFHQAITDTYHDCSYAHYGADPEHLSFGNVVWDISRNCGDTTGWDTWPILGDTRQGRLDLVRWDEAKPNKACARGPGATTPMPIQATILPPTELGDQTVPVRSSDHQLRSGRFKGVFRQTGYEHQGSYKDPRAVASTLYSIVRIAQQAKWKDCP
jgi:hypothetical protein